MADAEVADWSGADRGIDDRLRELLGEGRVFAVVGMSPKEDRPSHEVGVYLRAHGHTVIPVHPKAEEVAGMRAYPTVTAIPKDAGVEIVDLFVAGERTAPLVEQAAEIGAKLVWFQPGAEHPPSEARARELGLQVMSGICPKAVHKRLFDA